MSQNLNSVIVARSHDGQWVATHVPSGRKTIGQTTEEAHDAMRILLGFTTNGAAVEPATSEQFTGIAKAVAQFLEGPISETLSFHAGWARLNDFTNGVATIRLGGGCQGCPSSQLTLFNGVKSQLQSRFGDEVVLDVLPALDA